MSFKDLLMSARKLIRYNRIEDRPLTDGEQDFISVNGPFWREHLGLQSANPGGHFWMELPVNPYVQHYIAALSTVVCRARNLKPLVITPSPSRLDSAQRKVLGSYSDIEHVATPRSRYLTWIVRSELQARKRYRQFRKPEDVIQFEEDGLPFGDLIYDYVLSMGFATMSSVDRRTLQALRRFYLNRAIIQDALERYDIRGAAVSHVVGLESGTWVRYLLRQDIEVLHVNCAGMTNLFKRRNTRQIHDYSLRPRDSYVRYMREEKSIEIREAAEKYFEERFSGSLKHLDPALAFNPGNRTFCDRPTFAKEFGLDENRKNVFIMLHAFNDHPHMFGVDSILYRDYFEWFRGTLDIARTVPDVNWIFKEHPTSAFYHTKDVDLSQIFQKVTEPNILFLSREAGFNARSLTHVADSIVTCIGTAGLEYSCLGLPCLLGGRAPYSGFGILHEPATREEYEERLRNIATLKAPTHGQIETAKQVMYFYLSISLNAPFHLAPSYSDYRSIRCMEWTQFWTDAAIHVRNLNSDEARREIEKWSQWASNPSYVQFVDLDRFPVMRGAVPEPSAALAQGKLL